MRKGSATVSRRAQWCAQKWGWRGASAGHRPLGSLVTGWQIVSSRLLDGPCCSSLSGEEGKAATFPELIRLYYFLSGKPQTESSLLLWELKRFTLRNSQTIPWDLFLFNHLISILGNFKPAYSLSPYLQSESLITDLQQWLELESMH